MEERQNTGEPETSQKPNVFWRPPVWDRQQNHGAASCRLLPSLTVSAIERVSCGDLVARPHRRGRHRDPHDASVELGHVLGLVVRVILRPAVADGPIDVVVCPLCREIAAISTAVVFDLFLAVGGILFLFCVSRGRW